MNTCSCCRRPFGRIRTSIAALSWHERFCSRPCADEYNKQRQPQERVFEFFRVLYPAQPTR